jgi:hypothetical protein
VVESLEWAGALLLALVALVAIVLVVRSSRDARPDPLDADALVVRFHELYRDGKLSRAEYEGIRMRLAEQMRRTRASSDG